MADTVNAVGKASIPTIVTDGDCTSNSNISQNDSNNNNNGYADIHQNNYSPKNKYNNNSNGAGMERCRSSSPASDDYPMPTSEEEIQQLSKDLEDLANLNVRHDQEMEEQFGKSFKANSSETLL